VHKAQRLQRREQVSQRRGEMGAFTVVLVPNQLQLAWAEAQLARNIKKEKEKQLEREKLEKEHETKSCNDYLRIPLQTSYFELIRLKQKAENELKNAQELIKAKKRMQQSVTPGDNKSVLTFKTKLERIVTAQKKFIECTLSEECRICSDNLYDMRNGHPNIFACSHTFHFSCVQDWNATPSGHKCPYCAGPFRLEDSIELK
jgi:hypothetical protein